MSLAYHCDNPSCASWARIATNPARDFLTVTTHDDESPIAHACCWDCLMHISASRSTPTEVIA